MDTLDLSRIQFAVNISFHILFPAITIGLAWFLVYFKIRVVTSRTATDSDLWMRCYRFWVKLFALTFALGVVSGITMSFQFGTNWPGFMETVGNIAGPLLGYEVLTAFFMEATFLGIMLFGIRRVPPWLHTLATVAVAIGTTLSAFWIIALNSWMHTPSGYEIIDGVFFPTSWWDIVFNPSMPYRLVHVMLASGLTAAFVVAGLSAYRIHRGDPKPAPRKTLKSALVVAMVLVPAQILSGDLHGLNTLAHQPVKIAAMEGVWETQRGAPFVIFGLPNELTQTNDFSIEIPYAASLILTHELEGEVKGIKDFDDAPRVAPVFWSFRIMLATGFAMLLTAVWGTYTFVIRKQLPDLLLKALIGMTFSGWVGTLAGWYVTEIGRQPFLVQGLLRTSDAVTQQPPQSVAISLVIYLCVYSFLLVSYISTLFYLARKSAELEADQYPDLTGSTGVLLESRT
ncbi:MAG: cytochrome ubiquinol oxidase subunit I [Pseudomonadota bacterium]